MRGKADCGAWGVGLGGEEVMVMNVDTSSGLTSKARKDIGGSYTFRGLWLEDYLNESCLYRFKC